MRAAPREITNLLLQWRAGDAGALDKLTPLVYEELRRQARHYMAAERSGHTLQTTALVNEAYLRLFGHKKIHWQNRDHFFAVAAQAMRRILVDHARTRNAAKRGGGAPKESLEDVALVAQKKAAELVALDDALRDLAAVDPRKAQVVELRYFGGLSVDKTARLMRVSPVTVMREWSSAKAWLLRAISQRQAG